MSNRIMFLRDKNGANVGCVAIRIHPCTQKVEYNFSVANLKVDAFDREFARTLSNDRLAANPIKIRLPSKNLNMYDISRAVMKNLSRRSDAPSRAVKAAKLWLQKEVTEK